MPGKKHGPPGLTKKAPGRMKVYDKLRSKGMKKSTAAAIAWKGRTFAGRSAMAKKAARTRKKK